MMLCLLSGVLVGVRGHEGALFGLLAFLALPILSVVNVRLTRLAIDMLARVVAGGIDQGLPFSGRLTLWLSMIVAVGLASRSG